MTDASPSHRAWSLVAGLGVLALAVVAWALWPAEGPTASEETRSEEHDDVTVTATRLAGGAPATFRIIIDTHVVDLSDYDPVLQSSLETAHGTHAPEPSSEVVKNNGHHVEARLVFDAVPADGDVLVLRDLAGRAEWRLVF